MPSVIEQLIAQNVGKTSPALDNVIQEINQFDVSVVDSSWVETVSYDPRVKAMHVELQDGNAYTYYNISEDIYNKVISSGSPGGVINRVVKNGFHPFTRG